MERFSPKIEIINHFDNLINRVDIDIDHCLEKCNNDLILGEQLKSSEDNRRNFWNKNNDFNFEFFDTFKSKHQSIDLWPESTKVIEYLKEVRMKTIEELRKAQEDTLENYKLNSSQFKSELSNEKSIDELRSELFAEKFYFQVNFTQSEKSCWAFNVFTFVADFYMSPSDIDSLEKLINTEKQPFSKDSVFDDVTFERIIILLKLNESKQYIVVFKKTVLIGLLYKYFIDNLYNFPNHVIRVCKQDVLNIKTISFRHEFSEVNLTSSSTIDLSKLFELHLHNEDCKDRRESVKINIEGLTWLKKLHLGINSAKIYLSIRDLFLLKYLSFENSCTIDENIITQLFDQVRLIKYLFLRGNFSYFNLNSFPNLKGLLLEGTINESFNFELLKNLSNRIQILKISLKKVEYNTFFKLFDRHTFLNLRALSISKTSLNNILKREFINRFPLLRQLFIRRCNLKVIEPDAFSRLKQLNCLDLSKNHITSIEKDTFSCLKNLKILDLSRNELTDLDAEYIGVRDSVQIFLENKKSETFNRYWLIPQ